MTSQLDLHLEACAECGKALADPDEGDLCAVGQGLLIEELEASLGP